LSKDQKYEASLPLASEDPYSTLHGLIRIAGLVGTFGVFSQEVRLARTFQRLISDGQRELTVTKEQLDLLGRCLELSFTFLDVVYRGTGFSECSRIASEWHVLRMNDISGMNAVIQSSRQNDKRFLRLPELKLMKTPQSETKTKLVGLVASAQASHGNIEFLARQVATLIFLMRRH
jgi:hypothetical protein